jgi:hypothetical protein
MRARSIVVKTTTKDGPVKLLNDLFSTDYGLMSIIGIGFMLCMAAFFVRMFLVKMNEPPTPNPATAGRSGDKKGFPPSH